jgi:hypothetical protein
VGIGINNVFVLRALNADFELMPTCNIQTAVADPCFDTAIYSDLHMAV